MIKLQEFTLHDQDWPHDVKKKITLNLYDIQIIEKGSDDSRTAYGYFCLFLRNKEKPIIIKGTYKEAVSIWKTIEPQPRDKNLTRFDVIDI